MRVSIVGALCVSLCVPSLAAAEDVTVALPGAVVPVGPTGTTVINVTRSQFGRERFAVIRARAPEQSSRCGAVPERVALWSSTPDSPWTELAHELVDRCLPGPLAAAGAPRVDGAVRARIVEIIEGPQHRVEFHVRVVDPRAPQDASSLVRYHREGGRFVSARAAEPLSPTPGLAPQHSLATLDHARADGRLDEWTETAPLASSAQGSVWAAQQGDRLLVAGDVAAADAPTLTLTLADPAAGTARLRGADGNRGRTVRLACDDAAVHCAQAGGRWHIEGSVDLSAQLYSHRLVNTVAVLAVVESGGRRVLASDPDLRLEALRLATPIDLLRGASAAVVASCGDGFVGRTSPPGAQADDPLAGALVTCGATCRAGRCERTVGTGEAAGRLEFADGGTCFRGTGPGAAAVDGCRAGTSTRLVGAIPVQGFNAVLGVERTWGSAGERWHQGELWMLVTASSEWRRVSVGESVHGDPALFGAVGLRDGHPAMCDAEAASCEVVRELTMRRRETASDSVTGGVVATLREAGLIARRETP